MSFDAIAKAVPLFGDALAWQAKRDLGRARQAYLDLIDRPELTALCLHQLGTLAALRGQHGQAAELFACAIRIDPTQPMPYQSLAGAHDQMGNLPAAIDALMDLGCALQNLGQHEQALPVYRRILDVDPLRYGAWVNLGTALALLDQPVSAIRHFLRAAQLYARHVPEVGQVAAQLAARLAGAVDDLPNAGDLPPGPPSGRLEKMEDALTSLGVAVGQLARPDEVVLCHRAAVGLVPGFALAHWNLALALLATGDFRSGWAEYEWRWHWEKFPEPVRRVPVPHWRGEPLAGKRILVYGEQGFGDVMQFSPLVRQLCRQAAEVVFEVPSPLVRLYRQCFEEQGLTVVGRPDRPDRLGTDETVDYVVAEMSLPHLLGLAVDQLPLATAYLRSSPGDAGPWRRRLPARGKLRVGVVWAGRETHANDRHRSLPVEQLRNLIKGDRVSWFSLQVGPRRQDLTVLGRGGAVDLATHLNDFADTAAAIEQLDLVIGVDTGVVHLAAAMGKPCWVMLPKVSDWRWGQETRSSPWYPSLRIFRQTAPGDWAGVIEALHRDLEALPMS